MEGADPSCSDVGDDDFGFETISVDDAVINEVGSAAVSEGVSEGDEFEFDEDAVVFVEKESGTVWLKVEKDEEGFAVSLLDTTEPNGELWEVVDEVYLLEDDRTRSLSGTRIKVLTVGLLEAVGGLALSYAVVTPGLVSASAGCLALQCGLETLKTGVVGTDSVLTKERLKTIIRKNCILGTIGGITGSVLPVLPALPLVAQCSVAGAVCSASNEIIERREAEKKLKERKGTHIVKATVWGALTGNIPYLLDNHGTTLANLIKPE